MDFLSNAAFQLFVVLFLVSLFWGAHVFVAHFRKRARERWTRWLGVHLAPRWKQRLWVFPTAALLASGLVFLQGLVIDDFSGFLEKTSAGEVIGAGPVDRAIGIFVYPFITSALCEELLFRGFVAKRFIGWLGFAWGNVVQTAIFVAPHLLLVHFFAESSHAVLYATAMLSVTPFAWLAGWSMHRADEGSLFTPWLMHAGLNFGNMLAVWAYLS